jgi:hypothetical protein
MTAEMSTGDDSGFIEHIGCAPSCEFPPEDEVESVSATSSNTISLYRRASEPIPLKSVLFEPEPKQGWMRKFSRGDGLFRNWRVRYFVLTGGKLHYFQEMVTTFVGSNLKVPSHSPFLT